uniref:hypothetical protein n=1 Tax=Coprococcus sp. TaxID=2049024 RepID=UPI00402524E6
MSHSNSNSGGCLPVIIIFLIICYIIGAVSDSGKHTCYYIGCDREVDKNETYCWYHKDYGHRKSYNVTTQATTESNYHKQFSSSSRYSTATEAAHSQDVYDSYDDGYDDVYDNMGDYDEDRYDEDDDYRDGVDDAIDEFGYY